MLSMYDKTIQLSLPFLNKDGVQLKLDAIDLDRLPVRQGRHCVVEGRAPVGADIKILAMGLHHSHNLFRARAAIHAGTSNMHSRCLQSLEDSFQSLFLVKAHVGIAIPVLNADNHVADDRNARTVAQELLVGGLCVLLFRLYKLMVKVKIVFQPSLQLTSCK